MIICVHTPYLSGYGDMNVKYNLPRNSLSYSALDLWYRCKDQFRERYYLNKKSPDTIYTLFGKDTHEAIETDPSLSHIPRLPVKEHEIKTEIGGVPVRSFIDTFCPDTLAFYDYKVGIDKPNGDKRWTQRDVDNHKQFPFYALAIKMKYGKYNPLTKLIFLQSALEEKTFNKGGVKILLSKELKLTGHYEVFDRNLLDSELFLIQDWILEGAKQISEDYTWWQETNADYVPKHTAVEEELKNNSLQGQVSQSIVV